MTPDVKVTIVCGPPCSGKNWYVEQHSQAEDVIDWDAIAVELGSPRAHHHPKGMFAQVEAEYQRRLDQIEEQRPDGQVWIIRGLPEQAERERWVARFDAEVVLLTPTIDELMHRAQSRRHPSYTEWAIRSMVHSRRRDVAHAMVIAQNYLKVEPSAE